MITIGLTGSIGMGKSETAKIFQRLGVPVFDSDAAVHQLLGVDGKAVSLVEQAFPGVKIEGRVDRKKLGSRVFSDDKALITLERILHPMVLDMRNRFVSEQQGDIVLFDIPLLFEKGYENEIDYILVVTAPVLVQKERVLARSGMTERRFRDILKKQMPDDKKRARADFIIQTDQGFGYAEQQVKKILIEIRKTAHA